MRFRHPTDDALMHWLADEGEPDEKVDAHLDSCDRCAEVVEGLASGDKAIGDALALVLAPPPDLTDRLEQKVAASLSSRQIIDVVADLFGAGFETSRLLLSEENNDDK